MGRAAQVLEGFRRNYPNHELAPEVTRKLAVAYLETGRCDAGRRRVRAHRARAEERRRAARCAVAGRRALREIRARRPTPRGCMRATCKQYPSPLDPAMEARQKLADMAKAQNDVQGARAVERTTSFAPTRSAGAARTDRSKYLAAKATLEASSRRPRCSMRSSWSRRSTSR